MKIVVSAIVALQLLALAPAWAGPCGSPNDRASDGSRCGNRASSERPGGK